MRKRAWVAWTALMVLAACGSGSGGRDDADVKIADVDIATDLVADPADQTIADVVEAIADGQTDAETDAPGDVDEDVGPGEEPHPEWGMAGFVRATEHVDKDGELVDSSLDMRFENEVDGWMMVMVEESGPCRYYKSAIPPFCDPPCDGGTEYCGIDGLCKPYAHGVSAGEVTIEGLTLGIVTGLPDDTNWYHFTDIAGGDLFDPASSVTVTAAGSDVPAFEVTLKGVGAMAVPWPQTYDLTDGQDNVFDWEVQGDGALVELYIPTGHHASPPVALIWCTGPDADGQIVVPQALVEKFPFVDGSDPDQFQHPPWIRRVQREVVDSPFGPIDVFLSSELGFRINHGF